MVGNASLNDLGGFVLTQALVREKTNLLEMLPQLYGYQNDGEVDGRANAAHPATVVSMAFLRPKPHILSWHDPKNLD
jgi:hypothetical protein